MIRYFVSFNSAKLIIRLLCSLWPLALFAAEEQPIARYKVTPDPSGQFITVESVLQLQNSPLYLKDFGQMETIKWFIGNKETPVKSERMRDILVFSGLPTFGEAKAVYKLTCATQPEPGYRKRLMGAPNFMMAREGLFLGMNGKENSFIDVRWELPPGWRLALGHQGLQRFIETQRSLWLAGKMKQTIEEKIDESVFTISVLEGASDIAAQQSLEAIKSIFRYAWTTFGPLMGTSFGVAIFPRGAIGGGTALYYSLAAEENWSVAVHEMLHWWTNFLAPAWFREGVHSYLAPKLLVQLGFIDQNQFKVLMEMFLQEHERVVKREGKLFTLAESSANYDQQKGGGDMYGLMPLFASKLDREIQAHDANAGLEKVFGEVFRKKYQKFDALTLIKETTGYDPGSLFQKYFYAKVDDAAGLLK